MKRYGLVRVSPPFGDTNSVNRIGRFVKCNVVDSTNAIYDMLIESDSFMPIEAGEPILRYEFDLYLDVRQNLKLENVRVVG